jgi:hypothetical protein
MIKARCTATPTTTLSGSGGPRRIGRQHRPHATRLLDDIVDHPAEHGIAAAQVFLGDRPPA